MKVQEGGKLIKRESKRFEVLTLTLKRDKRVKVLKKQKLFGHSIVFYLPFPKKKKKNTERDSNSHIYVQRDGTDFQLLVTKKNENFLLDRKKCYSF